MNKHNFIHEIGNRYVCTKCRGRIFGEITAKEETNKFECPINQKVEIN